jgi:hypothetical protein
MVNPDCTTFGVSKGQNGAAMAFCNECLANVAEDQDYLYFLPEEYRTQPN